jgi:ATP-dependent RNA helicase HelY
VIFLVPTLALVDQLRDDLLISFPSGLGDIGVSADGDLAALVAEPELKSIEVMTPERCLALLSFADADVSDVGLIVFDECHLLSEQGGGTRSVDAMLCLLHVLKRAPDADLLLLSAMLTNGDEVAAWLQEVSGRPCGAFHDPWKPSRQARGVVIYPFEEVAEIDAAARAKQRAKRLHRQYRPPPLPASPHALFGLQHNWNPAAAEDVRLVRLADSPVSLALGRGGASPNANAVAAVLAAASANAGLKAIVFVQQPTATIR